MTTRSSPVPRMGRAALVVSAGILLSRVLGFFRDVVLAAVLGASEAGDVYDAAFVLPDFLFYLVAGGFLSITFIPILSRYVADGDEEGGNAAFAAVFRPVAVVVVLVSAGAFLFAERLVNAVYVRFPEVVGAVIGASTDQGLTSSQLDQVVTLTRIVLPAQIFFVLGALFMAVQYTHQRFLIPTLAPIIYNVGIVAGGILMRESDLPASGFIWGALGGALAGHLLLQWYGARRTGLRWARGVPLSHPALREYVVLAIPLMIGQSLVVLDEQLIRVFAQFGEDGSIFALGRARRLNMLPVGVIAQAAGVAAYPFLARMAAEGKMVELGRTLVTALRYVIFASAVALAGGLALSQPVVQVALQRNNFTAQATVLTAGALVFFSLSIPAWGIQQVYARGFYATRQMWAPVIIGTVGLVLTIPLMLWLSQEDLLGVSGLALASAIGISAYAVTLAVLWHRRHGTDELSRITTALARSAGAAIPAGLAAWWVSDAISEGPTGSSGAALAAVAAGSVTLVVVYVTASWALRSPELTDLLKRRGQGEPDSGEPLA